MSDAFDSWLQDRPAEAEADDGRLSPGTVVGAYRVEAFLGKGGFAEVYRAKGPGGEAVAVKILHRLDEQSRLRFEREANILSQIRHPNIPKLLSFGSCGDRPYLVTELLQTKDPPHDDKSVAALVKAVCAAANALHKTGYVHRDIKPSNVLWRGDTPVLIDFGLVCQKSETPRSPSTISIVDGQRIVVGTAGYAAPEQFAGGKIDETTDVHAIGMLADACFDGKPPKCWSRIIRRSASSLASLRYRSTDEFVRAVKGRHRLRNWSLGAAAVAVCAAVAAGIAVAENALWDRSMKSSGRLYPEDRSFSILPIDDTELIPLDELGIAGWGTGGAGDSPVVFIQRLAYAGDVATQRELQRQLGATYGGRTTVCEDEVSNAVLRVEIDDWREGERLLYAYRKLFVKGKAIYQVTGQTQMRTKDRDRAKLKTAVDSFRLR